MESKKEKEKVRYDYFVNKDNKMCPQNSEFQPQKVNPTQELTESEIRSGSNPSLWNSIGMWEERTFSTEKYEEFLVKNISEIKRDDAP